MADAHHIVAVAASRPVGELQSIAHLGAVPTEKEPVPFGTDSPFL
jgi:hypothetical protein